MRPAGRRLKLLVGAFRSTRTPNVESCSSLVHMSVRKISSEVRLTHWLPSNGPGCLGWLFGLKPPEQVGPVNGPIQVKVASNFWETSARYTWSEFREIESSQIEPFVLIRTSEKGQLVKYRDDWYWADTDLSEDDIAAVLRARKVRRDASIQRAKSLSNLESTPIQQVRRGAIPEDLRLVVWQRDSGKCVKCGSNSELQFDHVIPVALGGATSEENLQVLCGPCNRAKGASVS